MVAEIVAEIDQLGLRSHFGFGVPGTEREIKEAQCPVTRAHHAAGDREAEKHNGWYRRGAIESG